MWALVCGEGLDGSGTMAADYRGSGKFLSGPVVRTMACAETGFPLWNKASVTKISTRLLENFCQQNLSLLCVSGVRTPRD